MKTLFKWFFRLLFLLLFLLVVFLLSLDSLARYVAERRLKENTGFDIKIGKLEIGLLTPRFRIENLVAYNPPDFGGTPMVDLPELVIEYDRTSLLSRQMHLSLLRINLAEVHMVENAAGRVNLTVLEERLLARAIDNYNRNRPPTLADYNQMNVKFGGIDCLDISFNRLKYSNFRARTPTREVSLGLQNQVFRNVRSEADLFFMLSQLATQALANGGASVFVPDLRTPNQLPTNSPTLPQRLPVPRR